MSSLIYELGVVEERADLNPVAGRWRVVYEREGGGARFKRVLEEDESAEGGRRLPGVVSKVFGAGAGHVVYAVSKERPLALDFPRRVPHRNNVNQFDLNFRVGYHVADPRALVERLRAGREDPLERLREAVGEEFGGACARAPWEVIRDGHAFAEMAAGLTAAGAGPLRKVQDVARYLGLAVTGVRLSVRLLEDDARDWREATAQRSELGRRRQELERLRLEEDIRDEEARRTLVRETWKGGVEALNKSLGNIGRDTDSAAKLVKNLEALGPPFLPQNAPATSESAPTKFTAYYHTEIKPDVWYTLLAYAHVPTAAQAVEADSRNRIDKRADDLRKGTTAARTIRRGAEIVVIPELPGCRFNPPRANILWLEDWHRIEFRMQAGSTQPGFEYGKAANGRIAFYVGAVLIAELKFWAHYVDEVDATPADQPNTHVTVDPYDAVFVSYSHKDIMIVEELEKAYTALGMQYMRDVSVLRSGEEWNPTLLGKIDEADIFQLCWSSNAKHSRYVEQEWRHALALGRPSFIRPMYWQQPIPTPPSDLAPLHFAYYELNR